ncbi:hypothetical protein [Nonomuraea sp. JJY05]
MGRHAEHQRHSHNGSLAANVSTRFGFIASGAPSAPSLTMTTP